MSLSTNSKLRAEVDAQGLEWTHRWLAWGKGRYHVQRVGESVTVCGKEIPRFDTGQVHGSLYSGWECKRCEAHEEDAAAADDYRKRLWAYGQALRADKRAANQNGVFQVLRCKLCGAQHRTNGDGRGAVAYCIDGGHVAELEEVEALGPKWEAP